MTELEIANHTIEVLYICAYVGFALWGIAGWYVGRFFLKKNHIKPNGLINMGYVREVQDENLRLDNKIRKLEHFKDTSVGLWCIDRDPKEMDVHWIRENCFQLKHGPDED
jgi:hypothetical protein